MTSLKFIVFFLIFIIAVHALALVNYWYWTYQWLDIPMHFLGGFWVMMVYFWVRKPEQIISQRGSASERARLPEGQSERAVSANELAGQVSGSEKLFVLVYSFGFVALIGVFLEFVEFLYDVFISSRGYIGFLQLGAADTIADLFFDLLGAFVFVIIYRIQEWRTKKIKIIKSN